MKHVTNVPRVTLFPFLSVLLSTMGVLAFLSISFLLVIPENAEDPARIRNFQFEWVGAPGYVSPIYIKCFKDRVEYFNLFEYREKTISLDQLLEQFEGKNPDLLSYFVQLSRLNKSIKKKFGNTEYFPLILVYPDGVLTTELLLVVIDQIEGLNYGLEPMLPHWNVPYQELEFQGRL
tara:strand:+ start:1499 stop:2029 length:531 start_codon:yes stop_codon:yes gene_type:complete